MIARRWHGIVPKAKADPYRKLMLDIAIPDYRSVPGNRGARSEERRVGKEWVITCSTRRSPYHVITKKWIISHRSDSRLILINHMIIKLVYSKLLEKNIYY